MLPIVCLATSSWRATAERFVRSVHRAMPAVAVTLYTDDPNAFDGPSFQGAEVVAFPPITTKGVKRARFDLYLAALERGDFVYLDTDIIVVEAFPDFGEVRSLGACRDDLSAACDFIADPRHPWPGDPHLVARLYVNTGFMVVRQAARPFFETAWERAADNAYWDAHVIEGKLHDNHLLCAVLNEEPVDLTLLDPREWNWPGFVDAAGKLQVRRSGDHLVNAATGIPLRLVHFAGHPDVEGRLGELPLDIASLLARVSSDSSNGSLGWAALAGALDAGVRSAGPERASAATALWTGLRDTLTGTAHQREIVRTPTAIMSAALSVPTLPELWNGLQTGGAYLDGEEYAFLDDLMGAYGIGTVIETGAGETSRLFAGRGTSVLSLESTDGPWAQRGIQAGAHVRVVPFDDERMRFDPSLLAAALAGRRHCDLLFVDAPVGTDRRRGALHQLLEVVRPKLVAFHDAHRDGELVFHAAKCFGYTVLEHLGTRRGLVLLGPPGTPRRPSPRPMAPTSAQDARVRLRPLRDAHPVADSTPGGVLALDVEICNESGCTLSSQGPNPFRLSYHWFSAAGEVVVWEGLRTELPFPLRPGDCATLPIEVLSPPEPSGPCRLRLAAVLEGIAWLDDVWPAAGATVPVM